MNFKILFAAGLSFTILGCAQQVNQHGQQIHIVPANAAHLANCQSLGPVVLEANVGWKWDTEQQVKHLKNGLRNEAGMRYPNADTVAHGDIDIGFWSGDAEVFATAFKCYNN